MTPNDHVGLPYHWLQLKLSGNLFLDRIEKIVKADFAIKSKRAKQSWLDRLFIPVPGSLHYKKLQIDKSVEPKQRRLVRVDARGAWIKEPTPEFYDEVVQKYFVPYLAKYNLKHKSDIQLEIGKLYTGATEFTARSKCVSRDITPGHRHYAHALAAAHRGVNRHINHHNCSSVASS